MYSFFLSNDAVQPASQSCPMESKDPDDSSSNMCACRANCVRWGMSSSHVCVDCIVALFGRRTWIPSSDFSMLQIGYAQCRYCVSFAMHPFLIKVAVAAVSATRL